MNDNVEQHLFLLLLKKKKKENIWTWSIYRFIPRGWGLLLAVVLKKKLNTTEEN